jgi:predicted RNase H-like HicB family nuclease
MGAGVAGRCSPAALYSSNLGQEVVMKYRVFLEQDEDGIYVAEVPSLPGCISQGATRAEALANIKEAMEGYIESLEAHGEPVPLPISEELVEIDR